MLLSMMILEDKEGYNIWYPMEDEVYGLEDFRGFLKNPKEFMKSIAYFTKGFSKFLKKDSFRKTIKNLKIFEAKDEYLSNIDVREIEIFWG